METFPSGGHNDTWTCDGYSQTISQFLSQVGLPLLVLSCTLFSLTIHCAIKSCVFVAVAECFCVPSVVPCTRLLFCAASVFPCRLTHPLTRQHPATTSRMPTTTTITILDVSTHTPSTIMTILPCTSATHPKWLCRVHFPEAMRLCTVKTGWSAPPISPFWTKASLKAHRDGCFLLQFW